MTTKKDENELKSLLYTNEIKPCCSRAIKSLIRAMLEPIVDANTKGAIFFRVFDTDGLSGLFKRLDFSEAHLYAYSEMKDLTNVKYLQENEIWGTTEFVIVLGDRFSGSIIWDYSSCEIKDHSLVHYLLNSRKVADVFEIVNKNSKEDNSHYLEEFRTDRRSNELLIYTLEKIVNFFNSSYQENLLFEVEKKELENSEFKYELQKKLLKKSSVISHEIKNQLSIIDIYSTINKRQADKIEMSEESKKVFENATSNIKQSISLITHLLQGFKEEEEKVEIEKVDLVKVIENVVDLVHPIAEKNNIILATQLRKRPFVLADSEKLSMVFINMIYNAIDAIENEGNIIISVDEKDGEFAKISFIDTGKGIEEAAQEKLFQEGFSTKKTTGRGIGLYISQKIIKMQNGEIVLVKTSEAGTEFVIRIPLVK